MRANKTLKIMAALLAAGASASAFALTPGSGTWVKETTLFGLADAYTYVPKNPAPQTLDGKRALMVTLHGCAMNAKANVIDRKFNWEDTAEQYGMVVVAPTVPSGTTSTRSYSGCWDWFGANHSRNTRDEAILIKLIDAIKARPQLDIDPRQIYVTGLSSGGGVVITLGCVAPDYIAGMGINSGPTLNTAATAGVGSKAGRTAQQVANDCKSYAGVHSTALQTQLTSVVNGTSDYVVDPTHSHVSRDGMKLAYGATTSAGTFDEVKSKGTLWKDSASNIRVSYIEATGMGHAWPAGAGGAGGGTYVAYTHLNYPAYVTKFFFDNNLRVPRDGNTTTTTTSSSSSSSSSTTTSSSSSSSATVTTSSSTSWLPTSVTSTTTTTKRETDPACFTASNFAHVMAGRAYNSWGVARVLGTNESLGLVSTFTVTSLQKTGAFSYAKVSGC